MLAAAQVIAAVAALLIGATDADARVYTARAWPLAVDGLPAWRVYAENEEITAQGVSFPARQQHELTVRCEGIVRAVDAVDDAMHSLAVDALTALFASRDTVRLAPLNCSTVLMRVERVMSTEGEAAVGEISLALRVRFHTFNNAPEVIN